MWRRLYIRNASNALRQLNTKDGFKTSVFSRKLKYSTNKNNSHHSSSTKSKNILRHTLKSTKHKITNESKCRKEGAIHVGSNNN